MTRAESVFTDAKITELLAVCEKFDSKFNASATSNENGYAAALREIRVSHMSLANAEGRASRLTKERAESLAKVTDAHAEIARVAQERDEFELALRRSEEERARLLEAGAPSDPVGSSVGEWISLAETRIANLEAAVLELRGGKACAHESWEDMPGGSRRCADCGEYLPPKVGS